MANGLAVFKEFVADFRSVTGLVGKSVVVAPLADFVLDIGPPWPNGVPLVTMVAELCVLILVFEFWLHAARKPQRVRLLGFIVLATISFFGYLRLYSDYTTVHPITQNVIVHGHELHDRLRRTVEPGTSGEVLLSRKEYQANEVWTPRSITDMRLALVGVWLLAFSSLAVVVAVFVLVQRNEPAAATTNGFPVPPVTEDHDATRSSAADVENSL